MNNYVELNSIAMESVARIRHLAPEVSFHELLRQIEWSARGLPKLGSASGIDKRRIYFKHKVGLSFAPKEIQSLRIIAETNTLVVNQRFFGFFAPYGSMPIDFTHQVIEHLSMNRNSGFDEYLDMYLQRIILLRYRAWADLMSVADTDGYVQRLSDMTDDEDTISIDSVREIRRRFPSTYLRPQEDVCNFAKALTLYFQVPILIKENQGTRICFNNVRPPFGYKLRQMVVGRSVFDLCSAVTAVVGVLSHEQAQLWRRNSSRVKALRAILADFLGARFFPNIRVAFYSSPEHPPRFKAKIILGDTFILHPTGKIVESAV